MGDLHPQYCHYCDEYIGDVLSEIYLGIDKQKYCSQKCYQNLDIDLTEEKEFQIKSRRMQYCDHQNNTDNTNIDNNDTIPKIKKNQNKKQIVSFQIPTNLQ